MSETEATHSQWLRMKSTQHLSLLQASHSGGGQGSTGGTSSSGDQAAHAVNDSIPCIQVQMKRFARTSLLKQWK
eukprot:5608312-Amphidinium_carterae.1